MGAFLTSGREKIFLVKKEQGTNRFFVIHALCLREIVVVKANIQFYQSIASTTLRRCDSVVWE